MRTASAQIILNAFDETSRSILIADATLPDTPITYVNAAFSALSGYTSAEAIGRNCRFLQGVGTNALVREEIRAAIVGGYGIQREILNYRKDGSIFWNDLTIDPVHDALGRVTAFIGVQYEAGEARRAREANAEAESRLANIASHIPGYVYQRVMRTDGSIEVVYHSPSLNRLLGLDPSQAPCKFYDYVHPDDRESLFEAIQNSAANMSIFREEFRLVSPNGASHWLRSDAPPRLMENGEIVWDGLALEIGAEKRWESEIADQALRDSLTGLFTRAAWWQALDVQLQGAGCHTRQCGVLHLDIDGFGELNDSLGQTACDEILRQIAQRLGKLTQAVQGVGGRLGGDEFGVLIPACADSEHLSMLARSAVEALAEPMQVGEQQLVVHACVGTALHQDAPYDGLAAKDPASELMTQAELALRWAKQLGAGSQLARARRPLSKSISARSLIPNRDFERRTRAALSASGGSRIRPYCVRGSVGAMASSDPRHAASRPVYRHCREAGLDRATRSLGDRSGNEAAHALGGCRPGSSSDRNQRIGNAADRAWVRRIRRRIAQKPESQCSLFRARADRGVVDRAIAAGAGVAPRATRPGFHDND
jgi:diguanylate cyclase (GGDEF)-like protein/PAS domain S-box-containing protein